MLKTAETTASGQPKDRFHFTYPTDEWIALSAVGSGRRATGCSGRCSRPSRRASRRRLHRSRIHRPLVAGMMRGERVLTWTASDIDVNDEAGVDTLNAGLFPAGAGESHTFTIRSSTAARAK